MNREPHIFFSWVLSILRQYISESWRQRYHEERWVSEVWVEGHLLWWVGLLGQKSLNSMLINLPFIIHEVAILLKYFKSTSQFPTFLQIIGWLHLYFLAFRFPFKLIFIIQRSSHCLEPFLFFHWISNSVP